MHYCVEVELNNRFPLVAAELEEGFYRIHHGRQAGVIYQNVYLAYRHLDQIHLTIGARPVRSRWLIFPPFPGLNALNTCLPLQSLRHVGPTWAVASIDRRRPRCPRMQRAGYTRGVRPSPRCPRRPLQPGLTICSRPWQYDLHHLDGGPGVVAQRSTVAASTLHKAPGDFEGFVGPGCCLKVDCHAKVDGLHGPRYSDANDVSMRESSSQHVFSSNHS